MREKTIEQHLIKRATEAGGRARKWISPNYAGAPDRILFLPHGKIYFIELKAKTGVVSKLQKECHEELKSLGQQVFVFRSIEEVDTFFWNYVYE